jgi:hypothetical protein
MQTADMAYLSSTKMDEVLSDMLVELIKTKPADPISFLIDAIGKAPQLQATGSSGGHGGQPDVTSE